MALSAGSTLGPYQITAPLGAGGMGEVYRARDTKLKREVAIKVLPDTFSQDSERLARFQREAEVLASLNHPNIAQIHGLEEADGIRALVLELVEGPTLADRIARGPIPLDEALPIAKQIAEALEAAHERGIIHRDLKPANIKVTPDGTVKVLDFGLAKALEPEGPEADAVNSPTLTAAATKMGVLMGTAAYMSPEQARGESADRRADIWAFGVVLLEMLTGQQTFTSRTVSDTLAFVLTKEPDWSALPGGTPAAIRRLLRRCLEKDPKRRLGYIGDARLDIDDARTTPASETTEATRLMPPAVWQRPVPLALAAVVLTGLAVWGLTRPAPTPPARVTRTSVILPQTQVRTNTARRGVAISPTGTHVVYVANEQLYLRALDELEAQPLAGTEGSAPTLPFFSPDGEWIGFYSTREGALKKVALSGGAAVTLTDAANPWGASWGADDTIVFGQGGQGILRVAGAGGTADVLVSVAPPAEAHQPQMLPDGETVLYTLGSAGRWDTAQIVLEQVATGGRTVVVEGGSDARYLPTGHLVYALGGTLLAVPFDVDRLEVTGGPVPLVEGVSRATTSGAANADIARSGALVYLPSGNAAAVRTLVWVDRDGTEEAVAAPPRDYYYPRVSPDGTRVVIDARDQEDDIWIWDFVRETLTRLTFDPSRDTLPVWTPDGQRVVFESHRQGGQGNVFVKPADGSGQVGRLTESPLHQSPLSMSPDGAWVVFDSDGDLAMLSLTSEGPTESLLQTSFTATNGEISPDGRWLAYQSTESGQDEVYVRPFPNVDDGKWQISTDGGSYPLWEPDGRELFLVAPGGRLMTTRIQGEPGFTAGNPEVVFEGPYFDRPARLRPYDVSPDGQRFLMLKEGGPADTDDPFPGLTRIHLVLNWHQELLARVPVP